MPTMKHNMGILLRNVFSGIRSVRTTLSVQIRELIDDMDNLLAGTESRFLELGRIFQAIHQDTGAFTGQVVRSMESINAGDDQSGLSGVTDRVARSVHDLFDQQRAIARSLSVFEQVIEALSRLSQVCDDTEKITLLLNVISLNIGIESHRSEISRDMFTVFVDEVRVLARDIKEVTLALFTDSEKIRKEHIRSMEDLRRNLDRISDLAEKGRKGMDESALHVKTLMETSLDSLNSAASCTRDMTMQAGEIVVALQFHDIIRQKIEHILAALAEAGGLLEQKQGPIWASDGREAVKKVGRILAIQNRQIEGILSEIQGAYQGISQALGRIDDKVVRLFRESVTRSQDDQGVDDGDDPFNRLMACMRSLETIRAESAELARTVEHQVLKGAEATARLQTHVDEVEHISLDLHRKALNAIIKAAHLGDMGRGIEVFAQEVTTTSQATSRFASDVIQEIRSIRDMTGELADQARKGQTTDGDGQFLVAGMDDLARSYVVFQENIQAVAGQFGHIEESLRQARDGLEFFPVFSQGMETLRDTITSLIALGAQAAGNDNPSDHLNVSTSHYTMESERLAHEQALTFMGNGAVFCPETDLLSDGSTGELKPECVDDEEKKKNDDDVLGDNVELF